MNYTFYMGPGGKRHYGIAESVSSTEFCSWLNKLATSLHVDAQFWIMPEADVGRISLPTGKIFAKLDVVYGLEIECMGLLQAQIDQLEEALALW